MTDALTRTRALLAEIPSLAALLPVFLTGCTPASSEPVRSAQAGSRPPLHLGILDLLAGTDLGLWVQLAIDEWEDRGRDLDDTPDARTLNLATMCHWLSKEAHWITEVHRDFPAAIDKIYDQYREAAREPARRPWPCPDCRWNLDPAGDPDPKGTHPLHACHGCGRVWRQKELEDRLAKHELADLRKAEDAVPLRFAAQKVGRSLATVKQWVKDGLLEPLGFDRQRNCALYSLDHIRRLSSAKPSRNRHAS